MRTITDITIFFIIIYFVILPVLAPLYFPFLLKRVLTYRFKVQYRLAKFSELCQRIYQYLILYRNVRSKRYLQIYQKTKSNFVAANQIRRQIIYQLRKWKISPPSTLKLYNFFSALNLLNLLTVNLFHLFRNDKLLQRKAYYYVHQAQQGIVELRNLPKQLKQESQIILNQRLEALSQGVAVEQKYGIWIADFLENIKVVKQQTKRLHERFSSPRQTPLEELDNATENFDHVAHSLSEYEKEIKIIKQDRIQTDVLLEKTTRLLQEFQQIIQTDKLLKDIQQIDKQNELKRKYLLIISKASSLISESHMFRHRRVFSTSQQLLLRSQGCLTLGNKILNIQSCVHYLKKEQQNSLHEQKIESAINQFDRILREIPQLDHLGDIKILDNEVDKLRKEAKSLQLAHDKDVEQFQKQHAKLWGEVECNWQNLIQIAPITDDPLKYEMDSLHKARALVRGKPKLLKTHNDLVKSFSGRLSVSYKEIKTKREQVSLQLDLLGRDKVKAEAHMRMWICLEKPARTIINAFDSAKNSFVGVTECKEIKVASELLERTHKICQSVKPTIEQLEKELSELDKASKIASTNLIKIKPLVEKSIKTPEQWVCLKNSQKYLSDLFNGNQNLFEVAKQEKIYQQALDKLKKSSDTAHIEQTSQYIQSKYLELNQELNRIDRSFKELRQNSNSITYASKQWLCLIKDVLNLEKKYNKTQETIGTIKKLPELKDVIGGFQKVNDQLKDCRESAKNLETQYSNIRGKETLAISLFCSIERMLKIMQEYKGNWAYIDKSKKSLRVYYDKYRGVESKIRLKQEIREVENLISQLRKDQQEASNIFNIINDYHEIELSFTFYETHDKLGLTAQLEKAKKWSEEWKCFQSSYLEMSEKQYQINQVFTNIKMQEEITLIKESLKNAKGKAKEFKEAFNEVENDYKELSAIKRRVDQIALAAQKGFHSLDIVGIQAKVDELCGWVKQAQGILYLKEAKMLMESNKTIAEGIYGSLPISVRNQIDRANTVVIGDHATISLPGYSRPQA